MLNKKAVDAIQDQIKQLESIRDQLLPGGGNLSPIFDAIDKLYRQLLKEIGYPDTSVAKSDQ